MKPEIDSPRTDPGLPTNSGGPLEVFPWRRIRRAVDGYACGITRLIGESYGRRTVQQAWREFTLGRSGLFRGDDPNSELFFSWLFHRWTPELARGDQLNDRTLYGVTPTRAYLQRHSSQLDPVLRRYLEACLGATFGFYEIFGCEPCLGFKAREVRGGAEFLISEDMASTTLQDGDVVFASFVQIDGTTMVDAVAPFSFRPPFEPDLLHSLRHDSHEQADPDLRRLYFALLDSHIAGARPGSKWARH